MQTGRIKRHIKLAALAVVCMGSSAAWADGVHFVEPHDGATVGQDVKVVMAVEGMQVHAAGDLVEGTGHHHVIIDGSSVPQGEVVKKDATHKHFGKGQTEAVLHLTPGTHRLTLQFANGHHQSYGKAMSQTIQVHVK